MSKLIDSANAFTHIIDTQDIKTEGPLAGSRFAVKDVMAVKGLRIQAGNPEYFSQAEVAEITAPVITILENAGATFVGKTHTDELGGSLYGMNIHYGTPLNTFSPACVPGGSSSGSAAAVAASLVDFALGADTSGSVRAPASFCGLYGYRPTYGAIPLEGVLPISAPLDTVGILTREPQLLQKILSVYGMTPLSNFTRLRVVGSLTNSLGEDLKAPFLEKIQHLKEFVSSTAELAIEDETLTEWSKVIRILAMYDLWQVHKEWITEKSPTFGQIIQDRVTMAKQVTREDYAAAFAKKKEIQKFLQDALAPEDVAVFPTVPALPPLLSSSLDLLKAFALKTSRHTCISPLGGFPEITLPLRHIQPNYSLGISFMGREGSDASLAAFVSDVHSRLS